jgi:paraquat-inducible protein B
MSASNTNRWKLGLFVTIGVAVTVGALMWLGVSQLQRKTTPAYFYFKESVSGLTVGSPVEFLGVEVGRVEEIFPAPDRRHIEVRAGVYVDTLEAWGISPSTYEPRHDGQTFVSNDIRGQLVTRALTSVSFIEIDIFDPAKYPVPTYTFPIPWETIPTVPSTIKSFERGLMDALESWPKMAAKLESVLRRTDDGLGQINFEQINADLIGVLAGAEQLMVSLRSSPFVDGSSPTILKVDQTLDQLNLLVGDLRGSKGAVERIVGSFEGTASSLQGKIEGSDIPGAVKAVEAAGSGFEETSQEVSQLMRELRNSLVQLDATLRSVQGIADLLARDPGALLYGKPNSSPFKPK